MKTIKNRIRAVIFDMDGTIINTEHVWKKVEVDFLSLYGLKEKEIQQRLKKYSMAGIGLLKSSVIMKKEFELSDSIENIMAKKVELSQIHFNAGVNFIEGFESFHKLLNLHQISTSIATNADLKTLDFFTQSMNFQKFFGKNMYCAEHIQNKLKPDPALFLHAAQKLNAKPEECIVFEDSIHGFQAAKNAGMKCIAIKNNSNKDLLHHTDGSIENYYQAEEVLKKLLSK